MICSPRDERALLGCEGRLKVNHAAAGENLDGQGQAARAGYAVARVGERERILARRTVRLGGARPCPPNGAVAIFLAVGSP